MSRIDAACVAVLTLAGCTSLKALPAGPLGRPEPLGLAQLSQQAPSSSDRMTCELERTTGSHIAHQVCRTEEDRERERLKADHLLHRGLQQGIIVIH
ncbi:MAG TPA: hypothetical protein VIG99_06955 [Myxococcaceae bacterium]|jgi:hypothetical protein